MAEVKIKSENFLTIQGWMVTELNLKGNELLIYACIYGFSQTDDQWFTGSRQYLADWTNSTKQGVQKCLKSLIEKGLLEKKEIFTNGVKFCSYRAKKLPTSQQSLLGVGNKVDWGVVNKVDWGGQQSLPNNIEYNIDLDNKEIYIYIVEYLNQKAKTNYRATSKKTKSVIHARLAEGFTVEDFKKVIDKKCADWLGTEYEQYLRPETLFGTKFEGYLNANVTKKKVNTGVPDDVEDPLTGLF